MSDAFTRRGLCALTVALWTLTTNGPSVKEAALSTSTEVDVAPTNVTNARIFSGPVIVIGAGATAKEANDALTASGVASDSSDKEESEAAELAVRALDARQRAAFEEALESLVLHLEASTNPLGTDFHEDAEAVLTDLARRLQPPFTAAIALASGRAATRERTFVVAKDRKCPPGALCTFAWERDANAEHARARWLAWPIAAAGVIDTRDDREASCIRDAIRGASRDADASGKPSLVALALVASDLEAPPSSMAKIHRDAARAVDLARKAHSDLGPLGRLATSPDGGRLLSWLSLARREVLVVPRLGALSSPADLRREVDAAVARADCEKGRPMWTVPPRGL